MSLPDIGAFEFIPPTIQLSINNSSHYHAAASPSMDRRFAYFSLVGSANIAAGGNTATTAQLIPPSGKTTGDFQAGKISDDTNPVPSVDLASGKYTEIEFCILPNNALVSNNQTYQFRISSNGTPLNSYVWIPQWTIGSAFTALAPNNCTHSHAVQNATFTQKHVLAIANANDLQSASSGGFLDMSQTHRYWDAAETATEYYLYYGTTQGGPYNGTGATEGVSPIHVGNVTDFIIHNLPTGVTYYFVVTAWNEFGESVVSNETAETIGQAVTVTSASHGHAATSGTLLTQAPPATGQAQDTTHGLASTNATFSQKHTLQIQNAAHPNQPGIVNLGAAILFWSGGFVTLVEIDFTSGTRYYSYRGVSSSTRWYKDQLLDISPIEREVSALAGDYTIAETTITFSNADLEFSILKGAEAIRNRIVRIKFGDIGAGMFAMTTIYTGAISDWAIDEGKFILTVRDISFDPLRTTLGGWVNQLNFTDAPTRDEPRFMPILYGELSSAGRTDTGAVPCILTTEHTPFRYLVARHVCKSIDRVYLYGVLLDPSVYTTTTASVGGVTMQFIEFTTDQRDTDRMDEWEITADVKGITDTGLSGGTLIENPADQFKHYLINYVGISAGKLDSTFTTSATYMTSKQYKGATAILENNPHSDVVEKFMESFGMSFYCNRTGGYGLFVFDLNSLSDVSTLELYTDNLNIIRDSFEIHAQEEVCSRMQFNYSYNWPNDYFELQPDQIDSAEIANLGQDIRENTNLYYVRDDGTALAVVLDRMGLMRESSQLAFWELPIVNFNIDLNQLVKVSHWQGISSNGTGYQQSVFRILKLAINIQPEGMRVSAGGIRPILVNDVWQSYIKLGDETEIASSWNNATASDKKYGYLGDESNSTGSPKGTLGVNDPIKLLY